MRFLPLIAGLLWAIAAGAGSGANAADCEPPADGDKRLLWGDLHVHTAWSLDAYAFGALATPEEAYRFARGQPLTLASGETAQIDRPLDFTAVTDHAETFDLMYACTDPLQSADPNCAGLRDRRAALDSRAIFVDYLLPIVSLTPPSMPTLCASIDCAALRTSQWQRIQAAANSADTPCAFTALIGYEWTASPGGRHWHRNVIYRSANVPAETFDYVRYPEVTQLWEQLRQHCLPGDGCDVLTIPHNINWADGGTFDIGTEAASVSALRSRFERLAEIHQEKGSSECLPETRNADRADCGFELVTENAAKTRMSGPDADPDDAWRLAATSYYRALLGAGLLHPDNPLRLGAIGSTDTHFGTPGMVAEEDYFGGIALLLAPKEARLGRTDFNPGGLVAVWATENTRAGVFDALKRREAYATSGPRIRLRFGVGDLCSKPGEALSVPMGGVMTDPDPTFSIMAARDRTPLARIEVVKGALGSRGLEETVIEIASYSAGRDSVCARWTDPAFDSEAPAYWYVRVLEEPSPRWSKLLCEKLGKCADFPDADRMIQERAWSSPIWYQPGHP
ncbi:MAG: DUF3604 domain-containing protein [Gammaproteobacteria bacterium]